MRRRVMRIGDADFGIAAIARFARELERDDAGDVPLQREHLQVEHQLRVIFVGRRHANRAIEIGQRVVERLRFGLLYAALDLAHGIEIFGHLGAIGRAELSLQARDVLAHPVEQAGPLAERRCAAPRSCRPRRTGARTRRADALPRAAASSATTTRGCSGRRRRSRCRTAPPLPSGPSPARATAAASPDPSAARRSGRRSCPDSSRCSRSTSPWRRSGTRHSTSRASPDTRSSAPCC